VNLPLSSLYVQYCDVFDWTDRCQWNSLHAVDVIHLLGVTLVVNVESVDLSQMLAAKFSGNILINLLGVWAVSRFVDLSWLLEILS